MNDFKTLYDDKCLQFDQLKEELEDYQGEWFLPFKKLVGF